jgi:hypothetical protein
MIGVFRNELRAWFCEVAGAQSILHQHNPEYPDTGMQVTEGWWKKGMQDFAEQVRFHCHDCGVPMRGFGELACAPDEIGMEHVSAAHKDIFVPKNKTRLVQLVDSRSQLSEQSLKSTVDYIGNSNV